MSLFQRAKIQDKCKQFTTALYDKFHGTCCFKEQRYKINASKSQRYSVCSSFSPWLFQRAKIQDKCKQFTTESTTEENASSCFKEQRYKINASNSQLDCVVSPLSSRCFKEQRYKINASNSQQVALDTYIDNRCFKEQRYKINASNSQH